MELKPTHYLCDKASLPTVERLTTMRVERRLAAPILSAAYRPMLPILMPLIGTKGLDIKY